MDALKTWTKRLVAVAVAAAVTAAFFGFPTELACKVQPAPTLTFLVVLLLTPVVGRLFCECLCPLGLAQSLVNWLFHPRSHVRRVCTRLPESKAQQTVRWTVLALFAVMVATGFGAVAWMVGPYSIFGKALTLFTPGLVLFAVVMVLAAIGKGRIWCNWICPAGTLFNILSRKSLLAHKVAKGCGNCRMCFKKCGGECKAKADAEAADGGVSRREALQGVAVLAAAEAVEKTTDGGYAAISLPGSPERECSVLPPGAVSRRRFNMQCVACGLCVTRCPGHCLRTSTKLKTFGQPEMTFQKGYCIPGCDFRCARACPTGALAPKTSDRQHLHMGRAVWQKERCLRTTEDVQCTACARKCPVKAIHIVKGIPVVDELVCIGCGACEHVCPARPEPAMVVQGYEVQREVVPMGEGDVLAEMRTLVTSGAAACAAARDGVIIAKESGRGIKPLLTLLDRKSLANSVVADKIMGRAAAAICIVGGAQRVWAQTMSADAAALLKKHGVECDADQTVPMIMNRENTGGCPMDAAVEGDNNPASMVKKLREKVGM